MFGKSKVTTLTAVQICIGERNQVRLERLLVSIVERYL